MSMLRNMKVSLKLACLVFVAIIGFIVLLVIADQTLKRNLLHEKEQRMSAVVESVISQITHLDQTLPLEEAQKQAKIVLNSIRFDNGNYLFTINKSRYVIVHPLKPQLNGKQMGQPNNPADKRWFDFVEAGQKPNGGMVLYRFENLDGKMADKLSYLNNYAPWGWIIGSGMLVADIDEEIFSQLIKMGLSTLAIVIAMIILGAIISRAIVLPLDKIKDAMRHVVNGDMTVEIPISGKDEIGILAQRINESISAVRTALYESVTSAKQLSEAANRIAASAEDTSQAVSSQRDQLTQIATAMNEMSATVADVANHAESTAKDTIEASQEAGLGDKDVSSSVDSIKLLSKELEVASDRVNKLKEGVMEISEVTSVISGISEQTNLLALNAAIEAARAGEQGRGFAVVADEVRNLASRTNQSTEEIQSTINRLQQLAVSTADAMQKSQDLAYNSVQCAEGSGSDLKLIVNHIQHISDKSAQIATAAEEQSAVAEEMNRNISGINDAALEMSSSATTLARESENLAGMSRQLDDKLMMFKL
ncbi:methyl-accepting chemotaxis protein [Vibrio mangrovi]|uniref:Methyl-accepting chemotaxis protein n=1 Tax=Vibrio mangrovi TaxID=474394 RepID=A0A1Y6INY4_9VIBR|nr:methyl-accepting chemotaxis protein [Vibrio mangrovi]MDW6003857.1 methyl-accepting chemotaxis protein [Vibrio mangrovi]SMR99348.1 Methyl-accepting chemotaxis protein 4 [Vibrio mangrovi]